MKRYLATQINKRFELAEKISLEELWTHQKYINAQPLEYLSIYNKNNPQLFIEISNNLDQLKNNDRIKNISVPTKIIYRKNFID